MPTKIHFCLSSHDDTRCWPPSLISGVCCWANVFQMWNVCIIKITWHWEWKNLRLSLNGGVNGVDWAESCLHKQSNLKLQLSSIPANMTSNCNEVYGLVLVFRGLWCPVRGCMLSKPCRYCQHCTVNKDGLSFFLISSNFLDFRILNMFLPSSQSILYFMFDIFRYYSIYNIILRYLYIQCNSTFYMMLNVIAFFFQFNDDIKINQN